MPVREPIVSPRYVVYVYLKSLQYIGLQKFKLDFLNIFSTSVHTKDFVDGIVAWWRWLAWGAHSKKDLVPVYESLSLSAYKKRNMIASSLL